MQGNQAREPVGLHRSESSGKRAPIEESAGHVPGARAEERLDRLGAGGEKSAGPLYKRVAARSTSPQITKQHR